MTFKVKLAAAGVLALAAGGTGAALASGGHASGTPAAAAGTRVSAAAWGARVPGLLGGRFGLDAGLQAAADYLGIPVATLKSDLQAGKTLAQIADGTSGKSASGLIQALVAKAKSGLDKAVADGKLTQAQADAVSANLQQRITNLVNGTRPTLRPFSGPRGFGFGFGGRHTNRSAPPAQGTTT
jgi:hypothetical protein